MGEGEGVCVSVCALSSFIAAEAIERKRQEKRREKRREKKTESTD